MKEVLAEVFYLKIGGMVIIEVWFADDLVTRAKIQEELQDMVNRLDDARSKYGMKVSINTLTISRRNE